MTDEMSLRPRPGETAEETVERVTRAARGEQPRLTGRNTVPGRPGWTYGLAVRDHDRILAVTVRGPAGQEIEVTGSAYWTDGVDDRPGIHSRAKTAIDGRHS